MVSLRCSLKGGGMSTVDVEHLIKPASEMLGRILRFDLPTLCYELGISEVEARELIRTMANRKLIEPVYEAPDHLNPVRAFWWELKYELSFLFNRVPAPTITQLEDEQQVWGARLRLVDN